MSHNAVFVLLPQYIIPFMFTHTMGFHSEFVNVNKKHEKMFKTELLEKTLFSTYMVKKKITGFLYKRCSVKELSRVQYY